MPHKRAKRSKREEERRARGADLVPAGANMALSNEPIPKSIARVLNATALRDVFHKKRKREDVFGSREISETEGRTRKRRKSGGNEEETMQILPGESLGDFDRRVENSMRSKIRSAVQQGNAHSRRQYAKDKAERDKRGEESKREESEKPVQPEGATSSSKTAGSSTGKVHPTPKERKTEFETVTSQLPKRLNDVVTAPPDLSALTKGKTLNPGPRVAAEAFGKKDVIPPEQRRMMEIEREKAVKRYRELKERREQNVVNRKKSHLS